MVMRDFGTPSLLCTHTEEGRNYCESSFSVYFASYASRGGQASNNWFVAWAGRIESMGGSRSRSRRVVFVVGLEGWIEMLESQTRIMFTYKFRY